MRESRIRLATGASLPSPQLERLATSHPFVQQIDILYSSRTAQDASAFTGLKTTYSTAQFTLSELYAYASHLAIPDASFKALPICQRDADDTWCIDPRGILTLSVSKQLYERLGVVGKKLPFKGCPAQYVISMPLKRETTSVAVQARHQAALGIWDDVRKADGLGKWQVAYASASEAAPLAPPAEACTANEVTARVRHQVDVHVPHVGDLTKSTEEEAEDHKERLEALFEWVGMACLGAQRLCANDRVDPYVAVYEVPSPAAIDRVTHIRWKGLLDGGFVRSVIDTATSVLSTPESHGIDDNPLISITLHSSLTTPVAYIPEAPGKEAPLRAPGLNAEDTVCLILSKMPSKTTWAMAESIGRWDARWG